MLELCCGKKVVLFVAVVLLIGLFIWLYSTFNPESSYLFPKCIFLQLTGYRCPGCGSQRVVHCLLNGDLRGAFHYNAFLVLTIPYVFLLAFSSMIRQYRPKIYSTLSHPVVIITVFLLVILWWIFRNVYGL